MYCCTRTERLSHVPRLTFLPGCVVSRPPEVHKKKDKRGHTRLRFGLVWFGLVWFGLVWFSLVWFGLVWFGLVLVWFGLVWFGLVWFGLVWFGLIWFGSFFLSFFLALSVLIIWCFVRHSNRNR